MVSINEQFLPEVRLEGKYTTGFEIKNCVVERLMIAGSTFNDKCKLENCVVNEFVFLQ